MVGLLALAHDRGVEADLAVALDAILSDGCLPDLALLRARFTPEVTSAPMVRIEIPHASTYDPLLSTLGREIAA